MTYENQTILHPIFQKQPCFSCPPVHTPFTLQGKHKTQWNPHTCVTACHPIKDFSSLFVKQITQPKHFLHIVTQQILVMSHDWRRRKLLSANPNHNSWTPNAGSNHFFKSFRFCVSSFKYNQVLYVFYFYSASMCVLFFVHLLSVLKFYGIMLCFMYFPNWHYIVLVLLGWTNQAQLYFAFIWFWYTKEV